MKSRVIFLFLSFYLYIEFYKLLAHISAHSSALHNNATYKQTTYDIHVKAFYIPVRLQLNDNGGSRQGQFFFFLKHPKFLFFIVNPQ